jgi:molybdate transport system ATP-binding protein
VNRRAENRETANGEAADLGAASLDAEIGLRLGSFALDVNITAAGGSVVALLGPNGAGKTTILRCLAGLTAIDTGHIRVGDRTLDDPERRILVPPEQRRVSFVHQDLLLFPHLSVLDNIAFGPRSTGASKAAAAARARRQLDAVGLGEYAAAKPRELSGGQAQRVALARALVAEPDLLLLDEPLAALDVTTRTTTRRDLRRHLDAYEGIALVISHDPLDALMLAHDVFVLEGGTVTQSGEIAEITVRPRTQYVADLVGLNLLRGQGEGTAVRVGDTLVEVADPVRGDTFVTIAPSAITIHTRRPEASARNTWTGTITAIDLLGERVRVALDGPRPLVAEITPAGLAALGLQPGDQVWTTMKATEIGTHPT